MNSHRITPNVLDVLGCVIQLSTLIFLKILSYVGYEMPVCHTNNCIAVVYFGNPYIPNTTKTGYCLVRAEDQDEKYYYGFKYLQTRVVYNDKYDITTNEKLFSLELGFDISVIDLIERDVFSSMTKDVVFNLTIGTKK